MINKGLTLVSKHVLQSESHGHGPVTKSFRTDLLKASHPLRSFRLRAEIVMKCAKRKLRIYEVPISYHGRTYEEGQKDRMAGRPEGSGRDRQFWLDRRSLRHALRPRRNSIILTGTPHTSVGSP